MRLAALIAGVTLVLDQVSKYVVVHLMRLDYYREIAVWPPYLNFRMAWNRGANFGLFANDADATRWVLIGLSVVISLWVWIWVRRSGATRWMQVSAGLLVGGAIGNVIDRLIYGAVADFLNMSCCGFDNPYAFNVADIAIFAGALGLVVFSGEGGKGRGGGKPRRAKTP